MKLNSSQGSETKELFSVDKKMGTTMTCDRHMPFSVC